MKWTQVWTRPALDDMKKIEPALSRWLREAMIDPAGTGHDDVVKLKDTGPPEWRPRAGARRAFFRYRSDAKEIHVLRFRPSPTLPEPPVTQPPVRPRCPERPKPLKSPASGRSSCMPGTMRLGCGTKPWSSSRAPPTLATGFCSCKDLHALLQALPGNDRRENGGARG